MKSKLTIILTSQENFVWSSMQEIIPHFERCWRMAQNDGHLFEIIDVNSASLKEIATRTWDCQQIIITCFNFKMCRVLQFLKRDLGIPCRLIFHLHNQASIGLWPLEEFGILSLFTSNDFFISSCERDWESLKLCLKNPNGAIIPFSLPDNELLNFCNTDQSTELYFAGRISRQKNLAPIFLALHLLKNENIHLNFHIYGDEDFLGSPNMGISETSYESELKELANSLQLTDRIFFHGKIPRKDLYEKELSTRKIFISTSAHSDENFGMAAFRAICRGEQLLLSNWGGHSDFKKQFPLQVELVDIIPGDSNCLTVESEQIKRALLAILAKTPINHVSTEFYNEKRLATAYGELLNREIANPGPLEFTNTFYEILERRKKFHNHSTKIFSDYNDPLALQFLIAYGLKIT